MKNQAGFGASKQIGIYKIQTLLTDRVLIQGLSTAAGLELLATVHWVAHRDEIYE